MILVSAYSAILLQTLLVCSALYRASEYPDNALLHAVGYLCMLMLSHACKLFQIFFFFFLLNSEIQIQPVVEMINPRTVTNLFVLGILI